MEFILILFVGMLVVVVTRTSASRKRIRRYPKKHSKDAGADRQPFDPKSARPQLVERVLCGAAYVVDGDTLIICKTQIRLFGIDAPEINHPYGQKAKWTLLSLCKGQTVHAEITATDSHGRTVAKCYLQDGRDLSAEMVKLGLAIDWPKYSGGRYRSLETLDARKKLWLADARQKGRMHVWEQFEAKQSGGGARY